MQLKERFGGGEVTVFSHAPRSGSEALRKTLAMGADRVVIAEGEGSDSWQTASILAHTLTSWYSAALPEVILCGRQSTDFGSAEVPGMLAERLGLPSVCAVSCLRAGRMACFVLNGKLREALRCWRFQFLL